MESSTDKTRKHILVVEDEPDIRDAIAEALTEAGFKVSTGGDGYAGLRLATLEHPDLILLDLVMPGLDGHAMLDKLRQDPWGKDAKVIILSSMDDLGNIAGAHEGKILDYIIKAHHSLDEIINKVRLAMYTETS
ncbi:MAG: response regulator transcription factor [Patescibacteria group bacterium]